MPPGDLHDALFARIEEAMAAAERIRAESEVLLDISEALREGRLTSRCAWCGRYHVADRWLFVADVPVVVTYVGLTHTICDDCIETLQKQGMSV